MVPDREAVKQIMDNVYNRFYLKWRKQLTQNNAGEMMQEAHELNRKYDCDLCRHMIADLIECIEDEWRKQGNEKARD